ncbi:sodium/hydrogen exchanger 4-like, partial [Phalaenopsis equestris]|uniref:sodium/hydrogen exchanger 4-like n=1 Tax=Phalaenopsis equestris TaxID=78828 RepID=UPI0009E52ED7
SIQKPQPVRRVSHLPHRRVLLDPVSPHRSRPDCVSDPVSRVEPAYHVSFLGSERDPLLPSDSSLLPDNKLPTASLLHDQTDLFWNLVTQFEYFPVDLGFLFYYIAKGTWWLFPKIGFEGLNLREYLALGAIFSSTDTVCTVQVLHQDETPHLYSLVFGEGVVNGATSIVLFNAIQKIKASKIGGGTAFFLLWDFLYLFLTSTILGVAVGLLTAYTLKTFYFGRHSTDREVGLMMLMAYLSYVVAELLNLSGIPTVFFCGIVMSHYGWHNATESSRITTRHIFSTMSSIAETFIFLYVGMDVFDIEKWKMTKISVKATVGVNFILIILVLLGRATFVFPLSILSNYISSGPERLIITFKHQFIIWWAGLMRGAISIALAFNLFTISGVTWDPVHATMITSTIVIVLFTTLALGIFTKPLVNKLIHQARGKSEPQTRVGKEDPTAPLLSIEESTDSSLVKTTRSLALGIFTKPLVNKLIHQARGKSEPQTRVGKEDPTAPLLSIEESTDSSLVKTTRSLAVLLENPIHTIHVYWRKFDDAYMRPVFGGPTSSRGERR